METEEKVLENIYDWAIPRQLRALRCVNTLAQYKLLEEVYYLSIFGRKCIKSNEHLCKDIGVELRALQRAKCSLVEMGLLKIGKLKRNRQVMTLVPSRLQELLEKEASAILLEKPKSSEECSSVKGVTGDTPSMSSVTSKSVTDDTLKDFNIGSEEVVRASASSSSSSFSYDLTQDLLGEIPQAMIPVAANKVAATCRELTEFLNHVYPGTVWPGVDVRKLLDRLRDGYIHPDQVTRFLNTPIPEKLVKKTLLTSFIQDPITTIQNINETNEDTKITIRQAWYHNHNSLELPKKPEHVKPEYFNYFESRLFLQEAFTDHVHQTIPSIRRCTESSSPILIEHRLDGYGNLYEEYLVELFIVACDPDKLGKHLHFANILSQQEWSDLIVRTLARQTHIFERMKEMKLKAFDFIFTQLNITAYDIEKARKAFLEELKQQAEALDVSLEFFVKPREAKQCQL